MPWVLRGLRDGVVTSRYPRYDDGYPPTWHGAVEVLPHEGPPAELGKLCPTGAIEVEDGQVRLDRGRCILCARCVTARPDVFGFTAAFQTAGLSRGGLVVPVVAETDEALAAVRDGLTRRVRALRRSVHIRHVDAGSDGAVEWEIAALTNPVYDVHRLGIFFTVSPRHADILLVTGAGSAGMLDPLAETRRQLPDPVVVIAAGVDAISGGLVSPSYATRGGIGAAVDVDVWVPGSPPSPFGLLHAILLALG
ncbi:MAG TPA: NADH:ubiquinone oxidoreductase, partial [Mycobacteriales bacterium]|nr:NADH:ubiquinone oxidoreductase [Mycobacteriales bacterium]